MWAMDMVATSQSPKREKGGKGSFFRNPIASLDESGRVLLALLSALLWKMERSLVQ
jgi:hypothetical protein